MPYVAYRDLTPAQRLAALRYNPRVHPEDAMRHQFWVRPDGGISRRPGHHELTAEAYAEEMRKLRGEPVRSKGDLRGWLCGARFNFSRD